MKREEAIKRFQRMKKILSIPNSDAARTIEAIDMAIEALEQLPPAVCDDCIWHVCNYNKVDWDAEATQGYTKWLEKLIVDTESFEWVCEDTPCEEWCADNCTYSSIQAECLRHLYEVMKGGEEA